MSAERITRDQAVRDGVLVDVSDKARRGGFSCPVAFTRAAYAAVVDATPDEWAAGLWPRGRLERALELVRLQVAFGDRARFTRRVWVAVERPGGPTLHMLEAIAADLDGRGPTLTIALPIE